MNSIETIICLILLLMAVPDLCHKFGRPALANAFFVISGLLLEPLMQTDVRTMVEQVGEVGFLLVLFEVGLEIDLPKLRDFLAPLRYALSVLSAEGLLDRSGGRGYVVRRFSVRDVLNAIDVMPIAYVNTGCRSINRIRYCGWIGSRAASGLAAR